MKKVKHSWPWTPGQIVSLLILIAATVGLLGTGLVSLFFPEYLYSVSPVGVLVFGGVALILTIAYLVGNLRLKGKSAVWIEIPEDGFQTNVWMTKPNVYLYANKLDKDKNKGDIANFKQVKAVVMGKNDMFQFMLKNDRSIWVPGRLLAKDEVRAFFQKAIDAKGGNVVTDNAKTKAALDSRLAGEKTRLLQPEVKAPIQMSSEDLQFEAKSAAKKNRKENTTV